MSDETDKLNEIVRDTKASWQDEHGIRGPQPAGGPNAPSQDKSGTTGSVRRQPVQPPFPATETTQAEEQEAGTFNVSLYCTDASTTDDNGDVSNKVHVRDGEINGTLPDGLGFGGFTLDIEDPTNVFIYALVTFNPQTLAETSHTVAAANVADLPESRVESDTEGFLVFVLAEAFFDDKGIFQVENRRVGDINFELIYGTNNAGKRALLPVTTEAGGWLDLDFV